MSRPREDPREQVRIIELLVGGTLGSRGLVYLNAGGGFSQVMQAVIQLDSGAITAQPTENRSALTE